MSLHLQEKSPDGLARESSIREWNGSVAKWQRVSGQPSALSTQKSWGGRNTTRKLVKARQMNVPIITEEQFLALMGSSA
jgi:hypothetical protein